MPIVTHELKALILELQAERRRIPNVDGLVLTRDGKPIPKLKFEYWFRKARKEAGIQNFTFHDFRHCAITRWAAAGIPTAAAMIATGHTSDQSHKKYQNLQKDQLKNAFQNLLPSCSQAKDDNNKSVASNCLIWRPRRDLNANRHRPRSSQMFSSKPRSFFTSRRPTYIAHGGKWAA